MSHKKLNTFTRTPRTTRTPRKVRSEITRTIFFCQMKSLVPKVRCRMQYINIYYRLASSKPNSHLVLSIHDPKPVPSFCYLKLLAKLFRQFENTFPFFRVKALCKQFQILQDLDDDLTASLFQLGSPYRHSPDSID